MWTVDTEGFFIHVRPPGDLLPMIIRDLAEHMNLTNLGIIYDSTFSKYLWDSFLWSLMHQSWVMDYHLTALIRDQPIRVVINEVETWGIKEQLHRINDREEINNYFILGRWVKIQNQAILGVSNTLWVYLILIFLPLMIHLALLPCWRCFRQPVIC